MPKLSFQSLDLRLGAAGRLWKWQVDMKKKMMMMLMMMMMIMTDVITEGSEKAALAG